MWELPGSLSVMLFDFHYCKRDCRNGKCRRRDCYGCCFYACFGRGGLCGFRNDRFVLYRIAFFAMYRFYAIACECGLFVDRKFIIPYMTYRFCFSWSGFAAFAYCLFWARLCAGRSFDRFPIRECMLGRFRYDRIFFGYFFISIVVAVNEAFMTAITLIISNVSFGCMRTCLSFVIDYLSAWRPSSTSPYGLPHKKHIGFCEQIDIPRSHFWISLYAQFIHCAVCVASSPFGVYVKMCSISASTTAKPQILHRTGVVQSLSSSSVMCGSGSSE